MPASVLVIALDAAEITLLEQWSLGGELPTLAKLTANGTKVKLSNTLDTLPDALWPELYTGISGYRLGQYFHQSQIHTGEAYLRQYRPEEMELEKHYWSVASRAGKRVAVIDQALTPAAPGINGIQLVGWGVHNPRFGYHSVPAELCREIQAQYGRHPVFKSDVYRQTRRGYNRLLDDLLEGNERRAKLLVDLLNRESWDLFTCMLSESHCVGHLFWHFHDPTHKEYKPEAPKRFKEALLSVYKSLDATVAQLIEAVGLQANIMVLTTHGMGPFRGGYQLLPEVLVQLGLSSDQGKARNSVLRRMQMKMRDQVPLRWVAPLQQLGRHKVIRKLLSPFGGMIFPLESPNTRAAWIPNNGIGAIRLNLKGREPFGCVKPGAEADALIAELKSELSALCDPTTHQPIVERTFTPEEAFGPDYHPNLPDLMVKFRTDLGRLDACYSERIGLVRTPARNARVPRSGEHTARSRLWMMGPNIEKGMGAADARMIDIAPTILHLLDVPLPANIDGHPLCQG